MTLIPDYAQRARPKPANPALIRFILGCWFIPLIVGVTTFLCWLPTRWSGLEVFGFLWLGVGTFAAAIGGLLLLVFLIRELSAGKRVGSTLARTALFALLLASNFGVALLIIQAVDTLSPQMAD